MGKGKDVKRRPFTEEDCKNKSLVLQMLKHEDQLGKGEFGRTLYTNKFNKPLASLFPEKTLNRKVLDHFNFTNDDESVENYRKIFRTYYKGPNDYDKDVINAVYYMRHNRIAFYKEKKPLVGEIIPDAKLLNLDGSLTSITEILDNHHKNITAIAAFSES